MHIATAFAVSRTRSPNASHAETVSEAEAEAPTPPPSDQSSDSGQLNTTPLSSNDLIAADKNGEDGSVTLSGVADTIIPNTQPAHIDTILSDIQPAASQQKYEIEAITSWQPRLDGNPPIHIPGDTELRVRWRGSNKETWEPEEIIFEDAPAAVVNFWEGLDDDGRDGQVGICRTECDKDHVHQPYLAHHVVDARNMRVKHGRRRRKQMMFEVIWQGYGETSWEPEEAIPACLLDDFRATGRV